MFKQHEDYSVSSVTHPQPLPESSHSEDDLSNLQDGTSKTGNVSPAATTKVPDSDKTPYIAPHTGQYL